ncbi:hypothetical protein P7K49_004334 [Saguinus oedipus]|uniref:Tubulin polymerization promoting protein n=1 Tax=Saguinus oedipus TaxID=9490 RepID=A0ABQ9W756_SAGOE|nr:hypothetical protein P7K49_004334 [Saguinus oedipus]
MRGTTPPRTPTYTDRVGAPAGPRTPQIPLQLDGAVVAPGGGGGHRSLMAPPPSPSRAHRPAGLCQHPAVYRGPASAKVSSKTVWICSAARELWTLLQFLWTAALRRQSTLVTELYQLSLLGKSCRTITFEQFQEALEELAKKRFKDKSSEEAVREVHRLIEGKAPIISGVTKAISSPTVSRLTDTTKFTGSHKERFDPSGKGKGKAGRVDLVDESGYVSGYKHAGTYDQKVQGGK